jgi:hypothetical protein
MLLAATALTVAASVLVAPAVIVLAALAVGVGLVVLMGVRARRHHQAGAQVVEVLAPPRLDYPTALAAAARFWRDLAGITTHPWTRLVGGHPHVGVEIHATCRQISTRLWVPGGLHPQRVDAAVRAAWPGALTAVLGPADDHPSIPTTGVPAGVAAGALVGFGPSRLVGARRAGPVVLHVPDGREDDPLRVLEAMSTLLNPGEHVVVQVLARPATARRRRGYRRQLRAAMTGQRLGVGAALAREMSAAVCEVLDLASGRSTARQPHRAGARHPSHPLDPVRAEELRAARAKAAGPLWELTVRYAAAGPGTGPDAARRVRDLAGIVFGAFAPFGAATPVTIHRLRHPARSLAARAMRRGVLVSIPELAALAHLPTATPELSGCRTRPVLPPPQHTRLLPPDGPAAGPDDG